MLGAVVGGIASALAGGAASKLFGSNNQQQNAPESNGLATDANVVGMGDSGIRSAIQGSNTPAPMH